MVKNSQMINKKYSILPVPGVVEENVGLISPHSEKKKCFNDIPKQKVLVLDASLFSMSTTY